MTKMWNERKQGVGVPDVLKADGGELKCPITFGNLKMVKLQKKHILALGCSFYHEL